MAGDAGAEPVKKTGRTLSVLFTIFSLFLVPLNIALSAYVALGNVDGKTAHELGRIVGAASAPVILTLIIYGIAALWKRNRTYGRFVRFVFYTNLVLCIGNCTNAVNRLEEERQTWQPQNSASIVHRQAVRFASNASPHPH